MLQRQIVYFVDHAIDVVAQGGTLFFDGFVMRQHLGRAVAELGQRIGLKAQRCQPFDGLHLRFRKRFRVITPRIGKKAQRPRGCYFRIQLAQASGCGVARVCESLTPSGLLPFVQGRKIFVAHVHFAAHLKNLGRALNFLRDVGNRSGVGCYIFTDRTVTARGRLNEPTIFVSEAKGKTVDFRLSRVNKFRLGRETKIAADTVIEFRDLFFLKKVRQ